MLTKLNNSNSCQSNAVIDKKITDLQKEVDTISDNVTALTGDVAQNASDIHDLQTCVASGVFENNVEAQTIQANNDVVTDQIAPNVASDVCIFGGVNTPKVVATDIEATTLTVNEVPFTDTLADISCARNDAACAKNVADDAATCVSCVEARVDAKLESLDSNVTTGCIAASEGTINSLTTDSVNVSCELDTPRIEVTEVVNSIRTVKDSDKFVEPTAKTASDYYLWKLPKEITGRYQLIGVDNNDVKFSIVFDSNNTSNTNGMNQVTYAADDKSYVAVIAKNNADNQLFFVSQANITRLYVISDTLDTTDVPDYEIYPSLSTLPEFSVSILTTQPNHTYFFGDETSLDGGVSVCGRFDATVIGGEGSNSEFDNIYIKCNISLDYDPDNDSYCSKGKDGGIVSYANGKLHWVNDGCPRTIVRKSACCSVDEHGCECSVLEFENVTHKTTEFTPEETPDTLFDEATLAHYKGRVSDGQDPASYSYPLTHLGDCTCVHGSLETEGDLRVKETLVAEKDLAVHGDLLVDGTVTSTDNVNVNTTGNYIVTRDNNNSPMTSGEFSGLAVNNYNTGKIATITADCAGTWRVSDSASATATTYTDISNYNGQFYSGLSQTAVTGPTNILTNINAIELDDVVYDSGYYHYTGAVWTGPLTVVSGAFDLGNVVTDPDVIAALDALTKYKLVYYNSVTDKQIDNSTNQPLLTRNEESNLSGKALLQWDATCRRADAINMPTTDKTVLKACIVDGNVDHYDWSDNIACSSRIYKTPAILTANRQLLIGEANENQGYGCVYYSNCCKATFNPATGELKAKTFTGCFNGSVACSTCICKIAASSNYDRQLLIGEPNENQGYGCVYYSNCCKATFNPNTGFLKAPVHYGALLSPACGAHGYFTATTTNCSVCGSPANKWASYYIMSDNKGLECGCICTNNKVMIRVAVTENCVQAYRETSGVGTWFDIYPAANATCFNGCTYAQAMVDFVKRVYPVGSVYQNVTCSCNPGSSALLGAGTWVQITDKFIMARGTTYCCACGGSATVKLCACNMPAHCHSIDHTHSYAGNTAACGSHSHLVYIQKKDEEEAWGGTQLSACAASAVTDALSEAVGSAYTSNSGIHCHIMTHTHTLAGCLSSSVGSACAFSIIPPYCAVYTWYRCA